MEVKKNLEAPSIKRIVLKAIIALFMIYCMVSLAVAAIGYVAEITFESADEATDIRRLDSYFYEGEYLELYSKLNLNANYDVKYDMYKEAAEGYHDYEQYVQFQKAAKMGNENSEKWAQEYKEKVLMNVENCDFEENRKQLEEYAAKE